MNDTTTRPESLWAIAWHQLRRNRLAMLCLGILAVYVLVWLYAETVFWSARVRDVTPAYKVAHSSPSASRSARLPAISAARPTARLFIFTASLAACPASC